MVETHALGVQRQEEEEEEEGGAREETPVNITRLYVGESMMATEKNEEQRVGIYL